ncbi:related to DNA repair family protein [Rhynchosporium secalis]|uniref:Related to DNA repair family protein n=1 Tax=Rhynchosporium secalis TaxID=38038 RepID=A0A1E1LZH8_RHYSE|nr:related to DNA repair family protein [Rhynchosporium secalis]
MAESSKKRTLDAFFKPPPKKVKLSDANEPPSENQEPQVEEQVLYSKHSTYPFSISNFPSSITKNLSSFPSTIGKVINDQPDLDLVYYQPYIPKYLERQTFEFLRSQLPFYRVRYTTVFGLDETSKFSSSSTQIVDVKTSLPILKDKNYLKHPPRPLPQCLNALRLSTEVATGCTFNFCLVNYYSSGADSISYHSDDEKFLGKEPAIASFSLGAKRDFLMKHKPVALDDNKSPPIETKLIKLPLGSGDMILMKGRTQANWLHSIPKRTGKHADDGGRINITFRKALVRAGTENYYNYNVGTGIVYKWDERAREMKPWKSSFGRDV